MIYSLLFNAHKLLEESRSGSSQPALSGDLVTTAACVRIGYHSSMNTHRVVNVEPFRRVGLNKLAIDEQLGGGLEDHRSVCLNPFPAR